MGCVLFREATADILRHWLTTANHPASDMTIKVDGHT